MTTDNNKEIEKYAAVQPWAEAEAGKKRLPPKSDRIGWSDEAKVAFCIEKARHASMDGWVDNAFAINLKEISNKINPDFDMLENRILDVFEDGEKIVADFNEVIKDQDDDD